jgi:tmRNA-binding protein
MQHKRLAVDSQVLCFLTFVGFGLNIIMWKYCCQSVEVENDDQTLRRLITLRDEINVSEQKVGSSQVCLFPASLFSNTSY